MKFTPLEEIDFILDSLVKFSNTNDYDFRLFDKYAEEQAKVFNMYFSKIQNEDDKQKILSQLDDNFHFFIDDVVTDMLPNVTTPDYRVSGFKENYRELIMLFKSKIKTSEPEQPETDKPDEVTIKHPKHNPNYWNTDCFELFKYLYDEYYKGTRRQLTNIWFYLKEYRNKDYINKKYILSITKDLYKDFIKENYGIVITNFDKAQQKWEDTEYRKLDEHRQNFEDGLK